MFATLIYTEDGMVFKTFKDYESARVHFEVAQSQGYKVVMFDYDVEEKQFLEWYE